VTGRLRGPSRWVYLLIFLVLLGVALIIQGATVHKIGFGPISVEFGKDEPGGTGGGNPWSSINFPTDIFGGVFGGSQDFSKAKRVTGSWKQQKSTLTVEVTQVENQDGFLRLHLKVTNGSADKMSLKIFGDSFIAVDNEGQTHGAGFSSWPDFVPANGLVTGTINLVDKVSDSATTLNISFSIILGEFAPEGGITVRGVPVPH
jgi:hypothetical protein